MDDDFEASQLLGPSATELAAIKVYPLLQEIKKDVINTIDAPLSWDQLTASDVNFAVIRPLVMKYAKLKNMAVLFACVAVRAHFLTAAEEELAHEALNKSRAQLSEILAMKLEVHFASNYLQLVAALTTSFNPLAGASHTLVEEVRIALGGDHEYPQSALELAISTNAKELIASPSTQRVVDDIYAGRVVFSTAATHSVFADNYKPRPISFYNSKAAPILNHQRLRVPKYARALDVFSFSLLLGTYVLCLANQSTDVVTIWEYLFIVVALAFALDEYTASTEHGWNIYFANMYNAFDVTFIIIFFCYLGFRIHGITTLNPESSDMAHDILACGACVLFPRLAFFFLSNMIVVISLREMIAQFVLFIGVAGICFSGITFTLWMLGKPGWTFGRIVWLLVQVWFGNTYLSFNTAESFHPFFGPILMTLFAALANTLLLTILISILSNTAARLNERATYEHLFQHTVRTMEGSKSIALFSYQPPANLLAFSVLLPARWVGISPRSLHSLNVFLIKTTSFPFLIAISVYERYLASGQSFRESGKGAASSFFRNLPRQIKSIPLVEAVMGSPSANLYDAIFDVQAEGDLPQTDLFAEESDGDEIPMLRSFHSREDLARRTGSPGRGPRQRASNIPGSPHRPSPRASPRRRTLSVADVSTDVPSMGSKSPLSRLFSRGPPETPHQAIATLEASVKKMENFVEDFRALPAQKLQDELKELQERQARIENLLLVLTRGMRHETLGRQNTNVR